MKNEPTDQPPAVSPWLSLVFPPGSSVPGVAEQLEATRGQQRVRNKQQVVSREPRVSFERCRGIFQSTQATGAPETLVRAQKELKPKANHSLSKHSLSLTLSCGRHWGALVQSPPPMLQSLYQVLPPLSAPLLPNQPICLSSVLILQEGPYIRLERDPSGSHSLVLPMPFRIVQNIFSPRSTC